MQSRLAQSFAAVSQATKFQCVATFPKNITIDSRERNPTFQKLQTLQFQPQRNYMKLLTYRGSDWGFQGIELGPMAEAPDAPPDVPAPAGPLAEDDHAPADAWPRDILVGKTGRLTCAIMYPAKVIAGCWFLVAGFTF